MGVEASAPIVPGSIVVSLIPSCLQIAWAAGLHIRIMVNPDHVY